MRFRDAKRSGGKGSEWPLGDSLGRSAGQDIGCNAGPVVSSDVFAE